MKLRRSVLYVPASNSRALEKAKQLAADVLVFDLEDAVAPKQKDSARQRLLQALEQGGYGQRELVVRINGTDTQWFRRDLEAVVHSGIHAVCLPNVEDVADVDVVVKALRKARVSAELAIWVMAETPKGVFNIRQIACAHDRMDVILMGTLDLSAELRARHTANRTPFLFALSSCVMAAREAGIHIIDGVHLDVEDQAGLKNACHQGRYLGFDGKSLIHPKQIDIANEVFAPSAFELEYADRQVEAWQQATS